MLALDHYFDQDLKALEAQSALSIRRLPVYRLREPAIRMMGEEVGMGFESGLKLFTSEELRLARETYARWLDKEMRGIYLEWPFDIVVLPSDIFFFVRALPTIAHALGLPVVVAQKETTVSPETMEFEAPIVGRYAPFISDWMAVCSERQKEYWLRVGADPAAIDVTGQPRFDMYAHATPPDRKSVPTVLFFSYAVDAYVPEADLGQAVWQELRDETERVLVALARASKVRIIVKHHPQQERRGEVDRLRALAGKSWGQAFVVADPEADTRELVLAADIIVGFQTTALYEAVAAQRPVVYAAWGKDWERHLDRLIPFHDAPPGCVHHAQGPDALRTFLESNPAPPTPDSRVWCEEALGPIDGRASSRVAKGLARVASDWPQEAREGLGRHRRSYLVRMLAGASAAEMFWLAARVPALVLGRTGGVVLRQQRAAEFRKVAMRGLRD